MGGRGDGTKIRQTKTWTNRHAVELIRHVESRLSERGWHCGMIGSVLLDRESRNDLDIIVFPHKPSSASEEFALETVHEVLKICGLRLAEHKSGGHHVETWTTKIGLRVDVLYWPRRADD